MKLISVSIYYVQKYKICIIDQFHQLLYGSFYFDATIKMDK